MKRFVLAGLAAFAIAVVFLAGGAGARANGVPQLVKLTYLEGVSNFGPKNAEGVLEFSFAEAYARVDVKNLEPQEGYTFEGWLLGGGPPLFVGDIALNPAGVGLLDTKLELLDSYDYNLFVVSARKADAAAGVRPQETAIAGRFTVIGDDATSAAGDVRPTSLPETGEDPGMTTRERAGRTITIAAAAGGLAFVALRVLRRRKVHDQGSL
jgi:hypothetical protein